MLRTRVAASVAALFIAAGCSGTSDPKTVSAVIGPSGGTLTSSDGRLTLEVPAGAVGAEVTFTVRPVTDPLPGASGTVYELGPEGTTFLQPVAIAITRSGTEPMQVATEVDGRWVAQPTLVGPETLVATATHLSRWGKIITFADWCMNGSAIYQRCCSDFGGTWGNTDYFHYFLPDGSEGSCSCSFIKGTSLRYDLWTACVATVPQPDAGTVADAGATDAGSSDAGARDAGSSDAGAPDAGSSDGGNALLNGAFHFGQYKYESSVQQPNTPDAGVPRPRPLGYQALWGTITFDGAGAATVSPTSNLDGTVTGQTGASLTYSVAADRSVTVGAATTFAGTVRADGSMAVLTASNGAPGLLISIQKGTGFSTAGVTGAWAFAQYSYEPTVAQSPMPSFGQPVPAPTGFTTLSGTITFDGAGGATVNGTQNLDGVVSSAPGASLTYSVAADGAITVIGNSTMTGSVIAAGDVAVLTRNGGPPSLLVSVKKGTGFSNASLAGAWAFAQYQYDPSVSQPSTPMVGTPVPSPQGFMTMLGTISFDGAGNATLSGTQNRDGVLSAPGAISLTYSVTTDGTVTATGTNTVTGSIGAGGNVVVLTSTGRPGLIVAIKK